ncbi:MAG: T9SS type A sorting domain-containing protein [Paludibacteraceae bacterium]
MKTHKIILLILSVLFVAGNIYAQRQLTNVIGYPEGFASLNGGITGGEGGQIVTVTNADELKTAVDSNNDAVIILVKGAINVSGEISARSNKTIVGLGTDASIAGGGFGWNTKTNVIVQNITFSDAPDDLLKINNKCKNFWIDHCTFSDGASTNAGSHDGMLDVTRESEFVTISYNRFFQHDKNILIGHSDGAVGDTIQKVTLHHNWFDGTVQRNPRVRFGRVHCYNNYHVNNRIYGVASATNARVLVENCYFKDTQIPLQVGVPGFSPEGYLVQRGCYFENCGTPQTKDLDMTGMFPYPYTLDDVMYVPCIAETYSGANKPYRTSENFDCDPVNPGDGGNGNDTIPDENGCVWERSDLFTPDSDTNGWFWFNNETSSAQYIPSVITLVASTSSGMTSTLQTAKAGAGTDGTSGGTGAITGCIDLGKSATKGDFSGGAAIFKLSSCGEFKLKTSRTGDNSFSVSIDTIGDGSYKQTYTYSGGKGISEIDISKYTQTEKPVYVKIINGSTGSLNIHGVSVKSYVKNCSNGTNSVNSNSSKMWFSNNVLTFKSDKTCPAEISLFSFDGKKMDIPFRGWIEAGVENKLNLNLSYLKNGMYILKMTTNEGSATLKIIR